MTDFRRLAGATERRSVAVSEFEVRSDGDELVLDGYASVFESPYDVFGGPDRGGWTEIVDRKAFDASLAKKPDVHLLVNHEGLPLARTKSGTMDLMTDERGLRVTARLERNDPDVASLAPKLRRGDMDEMSFSFRTIRDVPDELERRRLLEVNIHKGDVSVVNFGANDATSVQLRRLSDAIALLGTVEPDEALAELRAALDNPLEALTDAQRTIGELLRTITPPPRRGLTVAAAEALLAAPR